MSDIDQSLIRVRRFVDAWPLPGSHADDIYQVWIANEEMPRVLRKSDLLALLQSIEEASVLA